MARKPKDQEPEAAGPEPLEDLTGLPKVLAKGMRATGLRRADVMGHRVLADGSVRCVTAGGVKLAFPVDEGRVLSVQERTGVGDEAAQAEAAKHRNVMSPR